VALSSFHCSRPGTGSAPPQQRCVSASTETSDALIFGAILLPSKQTLSKRLAIPLSTGGWKRQRCRSEMVGKPHRKRSVFQRTAGQLNADNNVRTCRLFAFARSKTFWAVVSQSSLSPCCMCPPSSQFPRPRACARCMTGTLSPLRVKLTKRERNLSVGEYFQFRVSQPVQCTRSPPTQDFLPIVGRMFETIVFPQFSAFHASRGSRAAVSCRLRGECMQMITSWPSIPQPDAAPEVRSNFVRRVVLMLISRRRR
jgi:hypothetical protein